MIEEWRCIEYKQVSLVKLMKNLTKVAKNKDYTNEKNYINNGHK